MIPQEVGSKELEVPASATVTTGQSFTEELDGLRSTVSTLSQALSDANAKAAKVRASVTANDCHIVIVCVMSVHAQTEVDNAALVSKMKELLSRYRELQHREKELVVSVRLVCTCVAFCSPM